MKRFTDSQKWKNKKTAILHKFNFKCFYCGNKINFQTLHIDHYLPRSKGGSDKDNNLVASCEKCNLIKNNKTQTEFILCIMKRIDGLKKNLRYYKRIIENDKTIHGHRNMG